jgi:hypothetical protein
MSLMTPEEHYAAGEEWLRKAERWDARVHLLAPWQAAVATAHFTAALYRPPVTMVITAPPDLSTPGELLRKLEAEAAKLDPRWGDT